MELKCKKMSSRAHMPFKGSKHAAGFDLKSAYSYTIQPNSRLLVQTDLQIELPEGTYGRIASRSGLAFKYGINVGAGVIDADYRGNIAVLLFNYGSEAFVIQPGDRIAQLICEKIAYPELKEVSELNNTIRNDNGFGSTGV